MTYEPKRFTLGNERIWKGNGDYPSPYLFSDEICIAMDVALTVNRPLLIAGPPGSGKTMLAEAMAGLLEARFLKHTLTSRSRLEDLTGGIDQLERLHDAHAAQPGEQLRAPNEYLRPGLFWRAFDPSAAARFGGPQEQDTSQRTTVILLDEIDKAEPDLPNDLLEVLDARRFTVGKDMEVRADPKNAFVVLITTNGERELPPAFIRRCVSLVLDSPESEQLRLIGAHHYPHTSAELRQAVADKVAELMKTAVQYGRRPPGTSEFLDALKTCFELKIAPDGAIWPAVEKATLIKGSDGH
jgi:MoxR-like ATPase